MKVSRALVVAVLALLAGCRDDAASQQANYSVPPGVGSREADFSLLFMGNSHSSVNRLPAMVAELVHAARTGQSVAAVEAPGWMFLEQRLYDEPSITLLQSQAWSFVILQAQKYSTSGQYTYSTAEAKELIRMARAQAAVPILFPEWPRRGVDETMRIYDLHVSIAQEAPACVAPIGQAWDLALQRHPGLVLHADDGNHSAPAGALLTALVLEATLTGRSPRDLPSLAGFGVDEATQALLRAAADDTIQSWPPRTWCPDDPYPPPLP